MAMSRGKSQIDPEQDLRLWLNFEATQGTKFSAILTDNEVSKLLGIHAAVFPTLEKLGLLPRLASPNGPSCTKYYALRDIVRIRSDVRTLEKMVAVYYEWVRNKNAAQKRKREGKSVLTMVSPNGVSRAA